MILICKASSPLLPKDALCQVWLKLVRWFWRIRLKFWMRMLCAKLSWHWPSGSGEEDFTILLMYRHYFVIISLEKGHDHWIPFTQGCFVPSLVEIGPVVLEKKMKMRKVYRQMDEQMDRQMKDNRQSKKLTWVFSSGNLIIEVIWNV